MMNTDDGVYFRRPQAGDLQGGSMRSIVLLLVFLTACSGAHKPVTAHAPPVRRNVEAPAARPSVDPPHRASIPVQPVAAQPDAAPPAVHNVQPRKRQHNIEED